MITIMSTPSLTPRKPVYNTPEKHALVRRILQKRDPPVEPQDYQVEGICPVMDVLATMISDGWRRQNRLLLGFFSFSMLVIREISQDLSLALQRLAMLVVCPTKALQDTGGNTLCVCKSFWWSRVEINQVMYIL